MILYLDTSALIKRYITEPGSEDVQAWLADAEPASTSIITKAEMGAAITKAIRMNWLTAQQGQTTLKWFRSEWESFGRLPINEATVQRADALACQHNLRGYDAIHLACALTHRDGLGIALKFATYDRALWQAAKDEGLQVLPEAQP